MAKPQQVKDQLANPTFRLQVGILDTPALDEDLPPGQT